MPSGLVNSVMTKPHPPRPRITRRNSVSVTPAMGASTAAGRIVKSRILYSAGNIAFLHLSGFRVSLRVVSPPLPSLAPPIKRSEEHTSELQSHSDLVCRLLLEKKNKKQITQ